MGDADIDVVAPLLCEFYEWLRTEDGGTDPETLLARPLTATQRHQLTARMDDLLVVWGLLSPLRCAPVEQTEIADPVEPLPHGSQN